MSASRVPAEAAGGDEATLVLLHGWAMSPAVWAPIRALLADRSTLAPALPGHAGAPAAPAADIGAWADCLAAQLPAAATVVGWSLGALLALDLAHRHPERVARLVLIAGTARFVAAQPPAEQPWPGLAPATVDAFRSGFADDPRATLKRFLALQCLGEADRRGVQTSLARALTALDEPPEIEAADASAPNGAKRSASLVDSRNAALADGLALLATTDLRAALPRIEQPCLVIHGEHDALMPVAAAGAMARALPRAHVEILSGCGHALPLSRSAECAHLIRTFADA
ncbi:MAG: pimeloyl-[acyl-carrier protein] methyl ester esterase [Rhodocyclaceae bacterium]|nr:pimeloyl-[acyl-carrier protein] methyl ester esterase [Rhodocyclaceae bacterium]